ncbi:MAG: alpha/beta hydrolase [Dermatophilaceae bacterium]|nr:alpha/beta hydrolase [Intrasporangiaceae bacterium]
MTTLVIAGVVGGLLGAAYLGQRHLVFFPDASDPGPLAETAPDVAGQNVRLRTDDGLALAAWLLEPTGSDRGTAVLYLPGNGGNRAGRLDVGQALAAEGFTVLLVDYRGYGANPGSPSEDGLAADARAAAAYLRSVGFTPERTVYVGESIGTGVTARLAASDPPAGIVLRSPFTSLVDVGAAHYPRPAVRLILRDRFESARYLADSPVPVVVLSGDADDIVPAASSAALAAAVGTLHREVVLPGVGHNDAIWFGPFLAEQVAALADDVID